jgi:hypothetical protein
VAAGGKQHLAEQSERTRMMRVDTQQLQAALFRGREPLAGEILSRQFQ